MPTYVYKCDSCNKTCEIQQKMSEEPKTLCPHCGKNSLKRTIPQNINIQFKGSGFYKNDYADEKPSNTDSESSSQGPACGSGSCGCC